MECERQRQVQRYIENIPKMLKKKRALEKARNAKQYGKSFRKTLAQSKEDNRISAAG
ncbi:hypothetical protein ACFL20_10025 [Spirochaetota bacterium]